MDTKAIAISSQFEEVVRQCRYLVDKTELMYELMGTYPDEVTYITRPSGFGKTMNMRMMESFFDMRRDSAELFSGLRISAHPEFCREWMNRYPVLLLSFGDVGGETYDVFFRALKKSLSALCREHADLMERGMAEPGDVKTFEHLLSGKADPSEVEKALQTIMRMMHAVYDRPVILLLDDYDVPLSRAEATGNEELCMQVRKTIFGILRAATKKNEHLKCAVVTGCLQFSGDSIFTEVQRFTVEDPKCSRYFGFLQDEVAGMLEALQLSDKLEKVKDLYGGYLIGDTELFCPGGVADYIAHMKKAGRKKYLPCHMSEGSERVLWKFVNPGRSDASAPVEALLHGGTISEEISQPLACVMLSDDRKNLWSALLMGGCLTRADKVSAGGSVRLRIPNAGIEDLFRDEVRARFEEKLDADAAAAFVTAMRQKNGQTASDMLTEILSGSISYGHYAEAYYIDVLSGIFKSRGLMLEATRGGGKKRAMLRVRDGAAQSVFRIALILSERRTALMTDCNAVIRQAFDKTLKIKQAEGDEKALFCAIAFYAKRAYVKFMK